MFRTAHRSDKGFSLVELLVTIAIIAALAAIAVPMYTNQKNRAAKATAESDASAIGKEIASMLTSYSNLGTVPTANNTFVTPITSSGSTSGQTMTLNFVGSPVPTGTTATTTVRLSPSSSITVSGQPGGAISGEARFCVAVSNTAGSTAQVAVYTNAGYAQGATTCSASGTAS